MCDEALFRARANICRRAAADMPTYVFVAAACTTSASASRGRPRRCDGCTMPPQSPRKSLPTCSFSLFEARCKLTIVTSISGAPRALSPERLVDPIVLRHCLDDSLTLDKRDGEKVLPLDGARLMVGTGAGARRNVDDVGIGGAALRWDAPHLA